MTFSVMDLRQVFEIRNGKLHRVDGRCCEDVGDLKSYQQVSFVVRGTRHVGRVHRIKFAVTNGFLPPRVDHKNRDIHDNSTENLRAANAKLNGVNISRPSGSLPPGVRRRKSGRFSAYAFEDNRQISLGTYDTEEEARSVASAARRRLYGDFYDES